MKRSTSPTRPPTTWPPGYLHLATEAAIDLVNHWISDAGLRTPESNRDSFLVLEQSGEIDPDLSKRLQGWA